MPDRHDYADRHLHFIVRHRGYEHRAGYGFLMDAVLKDVNKKMPATSEALIHDMSQAMQFAGPETARRRAYASLGIDDNAKLPVKMDWRAAISPAEREAFGRLQDEYYTKDRADRYRRPPDMIHGAGATYGTAFATVIPKPTDADDMFRAYWETLAENYPEGLPDFKGFQRAFTYPIPGKDGAALTLIHIGDIEHILDVAEKSHFTGDPRVIAYEAVAQLLAPRRFAAEKKLYFLHAPASPENRKDLCLCLDPLLKVIDEPTEKSPSGPPPVEKQEALATYYWLMAQSTPPRRGGSAMANLTLEHLAHRLRAQGYDYDIPHKKEGVDLWAHAATLSVETFVARFMEGRYFDTKATDVEVGAFLASQCKEYGMLMHASAKMSAVHDVAIVQVRNAGASPV